MFGTYGLRARRESRVKYGYDVGKIYETKLLYKYGAKTTTEKTERQVHRGDDGCSTEKEDLLTTDCRRLVGVSSSLEQSPEKKTTASNVVFWACGLPRSDNQNIHGESDANGIIISAWPYRSMELKAR